MKTKRLCLVMLGLLAVLGCGTVERARSNAVLESDLARTWVDSAGRKVTFGSDGVMSGVDSVGDQARCKWRLDNPYIYAQTESREFALYTILWYDFDSTPAKLQVKRFDGLVVDLVEVK